MKRPLLSELGPWGYRLAAERLVWQRRVTDALDRRVRFAHTVQAAPLPELLYRHQSLIMRRLGNVDMGLQEGKRQSLLLAAPFVDGLVIEPGETFSFWQRIGPPTSERGFGTGVLVANGKAQGGTGGGLCQFTNLLHWMVLHSPLTITEHHHHNEWDLFPDFKRQIPFGTGTSVAYNYIDYRFRNDTDQAFQLRVRVTEQYLSGELRTERPLDVKYHVKETDAYFYEALGPAGDVEVRRHNRIQLFAIDKRSGDRMWERELLENDARVCYDRELVSGEIRPLAR